MRTKVAFCALLIGLMASPSLAAIIVSWDPPVQFVDIAQGTTTINMIADIPEDEAIIGWGLDLDVFGFSASYLPPPVIGPLFDPVFAPDGDELAALVPPFPPPGTVWGNDVLLATLTFSLDDLGLTDLYGNYTQGDLTEGFWTENGQVQEVGFICGKIYVTPEPTSLALLALGGLALIRRR